MYDVIVTGAGPAGNIAALKLSEMGYRVAVLDWRQNLGDKLCTGIIGPDCVARFPPDAAHIYQKARTATVVSPAGRRYRIVRDDTQALIIDRVAYVGSLAQRAVEAGAYYSLGPRVTNIEIARDGVTVVTRRHAAQQDYRAQMVIVASGFGSPLLNMAGLRNGGEGNYMVGCQAEVVANDLEDTEVYLGKDVVPGSFGWLVPLADSRALAGIIAHPKLNGHMGKFLSKLQSSNRVREVIKAPRRWGIPLKPLHRTYADRVLIVGDAAGFAKPTTGGGIYYALLSGELAAGTADGAFAAGTFAARQLKGYEKGWKASFGRELQIGYYARMLYEALGDQQLERLLTLSYALQDELVASGEYSFDRHSRVILRAVGHRNLGTLIRSFGPAVAPFLARLARARFA